MTHYFRKIFIVTNILALIFVAFFVVVPADAADKSKQNSVEDGLNEAANMGFFGTKGKGEIKEGSGIAVSLPGVIGKVIGFALSFIGFAFFILMIYGGFIWMFSRGNNQDIDKAKDLIQAAIIGMIIVLSAYAVTMFIGNALTSGGGGISGNEGYIDP